MLIILVGAAPLDRSLPDGNEEWRDGGQDMCQLYQSEYESRGMTPKFAQVMWMNYIDSGEGNYASPSLETQNEFLNYRRIPACSVEVKVNVNVATNVWQSHVADTLADDDNRGFEGAIELDEIMRVGAKPQLQNL